jgi:poly-gamma-glutamate synthesis protein (capsule biosynthesis protein)
VTRLTFLGDTLVGGEGQPVLEAKGYGWAFDGIRELFSDSDLVIANHEGPLTERAHAEGKLDTGRKRYWYRAAAESTQALLDVGIRVVSLANNHVLDFGTEGLADTIDALDAAGIAHCGAGPSRRDARRPVVIDVNGLRIGFLAFMQRYDLYVAERVYAARAHPGTMRLGLERARRDFTRLAPRVDFSVALAHWGRNYKRRNPRQQRLARGLCDVGADLVIGHHPHIPHPVRIIRDVPVFYSLGNGPLGTPGRFHSGRPPFGLVVSVDLDDDAVIRRLTLTPIHVDNAYVNFQPQIADGVDARALLEQLLPTKLDWRQDGASVIAELGTPEAGNGSGELVEPLAANGYLAPLVTAD